MRIIAICAATALASNVEVEPMTQEDALIAEQEDNELFEELGDAPTMDEMVEAEKEADLPEPEEFLA